MADTLPQVHGAGTSMTILLQPSPLLFQACVALCLCFLISFADPGCAGVPTLWVDVASPTEGIKASESHGVALPRLAIDILAIYQLLHLFSIFIRVDICLNKL